MIAKSLARASTFLLGTWRLASPAKRQQRHFSVYTACRTDGVYSELTAMRTRTPFIEALRKQQEGVDPSGPSVIAATRTEKPDTSPKSMSESYHRVVSHITE